MSELKNWVDPKTFSKLEAFAALIHSWNSRINLTGYKNVDDIQSLLIGESVAALRALEIRDCDILDFGSGAGIPGLVWSIFEPTLRVTSLEVRHKKVAFQKEALRRLGLEAEVLCGHFPEAVASRKFDCIVSRAIRFDAPVWDQAKALLKEGGRLVRFAAPEVREPGWRTLPVSSRTSLLLFP